ncbi:Hypothetical predicted protein [Mytilus galloprovincialis]|uniref:Uncharacterized protein n=1 Tax=Mytilus galloprovincialis TaxID=29158 RepID=A0A8B6EC00_MYTGA|nr:Hypothetical predicted protein [Mytilus galloprovincialis]
MPNLNQVVQTIMSANGSELNVTGKGEFHIWIDHNVYLAEAVVADLALDGIIGLDFLKKNRCLINLQEEHMVCNNQVIPLNFTGQLGCYRVSVVEDTCIQPGTEALVRGHINEYPSTKNEVGLGIIEPCDKFVAKDSALMARTLVKASETVPLRFMNVSNVVKIIRAGTIVGNISPIQDVISDDKNITDIHKDQNLRIELQKLLSNCSENLSQEQKRGVENLLNEYKDLFAASDRDLGRTNLVRHTINTGNNAPVKQPPRRTPIHMREEVDRHIDDMLERGNEVVQGPTSERRETEMNELEIQDDAFVPESVLPEIFNEELDSADNIVDQSDSRDESGYAGRPRRVTKQPTWLMILNGKTKVTVRNRQDWRCHFCNTDCKTEGAWDVHTLKCAKEKREKKSFGAQSPDAVMLRQENRT